MWRRSLRRHRPTGAEAHQELVVLLGLEGSAQYLVDGLVYALRRGSLLWAMAGQQHVLLSETAGFDMRVVLVADAALPEHRSGLPPLRGTDLPPRQLVDSAVTELEQIADAQTSTAGLAARHAGLLWWLSRAWALWHAVPDGRGRAVHPAVDQAARLWRDDPTRGVPQIAQEVGLSPGRLGRRFRTDLGHSVTDYRTDQKLARATTLRAEAAHQNWTTIALDAGFGSYSQFY
ncbi:MAG: AraC family transcriptional regulator [Pseudoprimorskyibacter sp.]|nr:AraC family transcriptional regulator [Pseudoprimorskyibacter sp.]